MSAHVGFFASMAIVGIIGFIMALRAAYLHGYARGYDTGRDEGYGDPDAVISFHRKEPDGPICISRTAGGGGGGGEPDKQARWPK